MKRILSLLLALALLGALAACGEKSAPPAPLDPAETQTGTQPQAEPSGAAEPQLQTEPPESAAKSWHFVLARGAYQNEYRHEDGTLLAEMDCETLALRLADESGAVYEGEGEAPPEEMLRACETFNEALALDVDADFAELVSAAEMNYEIARDYGGYFSPCTTESSFTCAQVGELLSVERDGWESWGGAHPNGFVSAMNFDLREGVFVTWEDLTDEPETLRALLGKQVENRCYESGLADGLYDGFNEDALALNGAEIAFDAEGMRITFSEYTIGPHAVGLPAFAVEHARYAYLLNARGERLLALPRETRILGDFYEAQELWDFFNMTTMPYDIEHPREMLDGDYYPVTYRGITTRADLRALLETRFSQELVDELLVPESGQYDHYREIDGVLCTMPADRGSDMGYGNAAYAVELDGNSGRIVATVEVLDLEADMVLNETTGWYEWPLAGYTTFAFPFELTETGARFTDFQSIW